MIMRKVDEILESLNRAEVKFELDSKADTIERGLQAINEKHGEDYCPCVMISVISEDDRCKYVCPCSEMRSTDVCKCGAFKLINKEN